MKILGKFLVVLVPLAFVKAGFDLPLEIVESSAFSLVADSDSEDGIDKALKNINDLQLMTTLYVGARKQKLKFFIAPGPPREPSRWFRTEAKLVSC